MVTLLTVLAILAIIGIGLYFWQKTTPDTSELVLPPQPDARSLFADDVSVTEDEKKQLAIAAAERAESLISQSQSGDRSALNEAHELGDPDLYNRVLSELVKRADSEPKLLALMSHVTQNNLPVSVALAEAAIASWLRSPDRNSTSKALHFAALSDDVDVYGRAVDHALKLWREEKLRDISPTELRALFEGEFWILSSRSRSSGAGFVLKRTLASARRELEAAASANQ